MSENETRPVAEWERWEIRPSYSSPGSRTVYRDGRSMVTWSVSGAEAFAALLAEAKQAAPVRSDGPLKLEFKSAREWDCFPWRLRLNGGRLDWLAEEQAAAVAVQLGIDLDSLRPASSPATVMVPWQEAPGRTLPDGRRIGAAVPASSSVAHAGVVVAIAGASGMVEVLAEDGQ